MIRALDVMARVAIRVPSLTLAALLTATVVLAGFAAELEVDPGFEGFAPDDGIADVLDDVRDRFGSAGSVQILVDAGPGGDVLDKDVLVAVDAFGEQIESDPIVAPSLGEERAGRPAVISFAFPFAMAAEAADDDLADMPTATVELIIEAVLDDAYDDIAPLLSGDLDRDRGHARSGLVQVAFTRDVDDDVRRAAELRVGEIASSFDHPGLRAGVVSFAAIEQSIEESLERDMPILLGTSLALVLLVLALLFRSFADVLVGFVGLLASIVWMAGAGTLLGPKYLGLIGDFTQVGIAIPVLLVGLGIDYSVHLTSRYREQRARGEDPTNSARAAMTTVGFALVLATVASIAGFLANIATPLPPIRDFGILAAVGILAAFIVLGGAVPATRTLIDRRVTSRPARNPAARRIRRADPWWVRTAVATATRTPWPALGLTAVALTIGVVSATGLDTEFNERDFLPSGDPVISTLERLDDQFGGDVGERTFVVIDADIADAGAVGAAVAYEDALVDVPQVRRVGDRADVVSPFFVIDMLAEQGERVRDRIADDIERWSDPQRAADDVDLPDPIDESMIDDEDELDLPDDLERVLAPRLPAGRTTVGALIATMDPAELTRTVREALADEFRDDRPATMRDDDLEHLAQLRADELDLATLASYGYPVDELDSDEIELLDVVHALEDIGWRDDRSGDADTWVDAIAVIERLMPDELANVLDDDGILLNVATTGGQDTAEQLAAVLESRAEALRDAGATVTIASDALMEAEIISSLSAAQIQAILISLVAAASLLVGASVFTARSVGLGLIGIVPSVVALVLVLGSMRVVGIPFNALTATVASIAVGIGVPYGIHLINRFREDRALGLDPDEAITDTLRNTGPALAGSAITTGLAFAVLTRSEALPVVQFGQVSFLMIGFALLACLFVQPALLVLWARRRDIVGARARRTR